LRLPFDNGPPLFRAVAVPVPTEGGDEPMSFKMIVFGLLERAKHFPDSARERGARGSAVVTFTLDDAGELTNVSLLRSSGDADLDAESLALVARAAPFPKPPPDAQHAFAAEITFGLERRE
jgi:colicin import membrane protein